MFTLKAYTAPQLRKMNTERLHKVYQQITGREKFNPYQEREDMVIEILGRIERIVYAVCFRAEEFASFLSPAAVCKAIARQGRRMVEDAARKLTDTQVRAIRIARAFGCTFKYIAQLFGIHTTYVFNIVNFKLLAYVG